MSCVRGVFLSCLLYHEDKVLVTNEDFLPVIEVDETYPGSIYNDFHWLLKVCTNPAITLPPKAVKAAYSIHKRCDNFDIFVNDSHFNLNETLEVKKMATKWVLETCWHFCYYDIYIAESAEKTNWIWLKFSSIR